MKYYSCCYKPLATCKCVQLYVYVRLNGQHQAMLGEFMVCLCD